MKLFADTADVAVLKDLIATGFVEGVTTNPTLIAKSGRPMVEVIAEICTLTDGPVSAEVGAATIAGMLAEGRALAAIAPNVVIKLPLTLDGLAVCRTLAADGIRSNVTLCFTVAQAILAAKAGAAYISPFIGRLEDIGQDGLGLIADIRAAYDRAGVKTQVLAASIRSADHVGGCAVRGADCATIPPAVFQSLIQHPLTDKGLALFDADWKAAGLKIL